MTPIAILLVTISAFAHAFWNLLGKRQNPTAAFFFVASLFAAVCFSPLLLVFRHAIPLIPGSVWLWLALTSLFETVYYIGLAGAYRHGDMSLAYPLARALPVILVALVSLSLGLGKPLNTIGVAGILAVAAGCLILPLHNPGEIRLSNYLNTCCLLACVAALGTTGYTLIDNQALLELRSVPTIGLSKTELAYLYLALESITIPIFMAAYIIFSAPERRELRQVWQTGKRIAFLTGLLIIGAYGLVLTSMAYVSNISYIAAFRQLSIPLGAILGILVQKEPAHAPKILGIVIIFAGLVMIMLV